MIKKTTKNLNKELTKACSNSHLTMLKYLLTISDLTEHPNIHAQKNCSLYYVKYLLTSLELKEHADIHYQDDCALYCACREGDLDIVKYLLTSPELKEHANIYANLSGSFKSVCIFNHQHIIEYLIFDYKIEKTNDIELYLVNNNYHHILNMFNKKELEEKLQIILKDKKAINDKMKI